jgi:hypothetical protein
MAADHNAFIVSTFASWAGDFRQARTLLTEALLLEGHNGYGAPHPKQDEGRWKEDERRWEHPPLLQYVIQERLKQLADQESVPGAHAGVVRRAKPLELHTTHLRGAVWRIDYREFLLQAYLVDLNRERELFVRARQHASRAPERPTTKAMDLSSETDGATRVVYGPLGGSWVVVGNPFIRAHVSDMGLIEAIGVWTEAEVDETAGEEIRLAFERLLTSLDPGTEGQGSDRRTG